MELAALVLAVWWRHLLAVAAAVLVVVWVRDNLWLAGSIAAGVFVLGWLVVRYAPQPTEAQRGAIRKRFKKQIRG